MLRPLIRVAPSFVLENSLLSLCPSGMVEIAEALAAEFVIERTLERGRDGIVNRLLLCTSPEKLNTWIRIPDEYVSVIDVLRPSSQNASNNRMQLRRRLQGARFADLKVRIYVFCSYTKQSRTSDLDNGLESHYRSS